MVKEIILRRFALLCAVFMLLTFCGVQEAFGEKQLVCDEADLFTTVEEGQLAQRAKDLGSAYEMDIVIVTTKDTRGKSSRDYADDFYDDNGYGVGTEKDGILFLIDMDNREVDISTSGQGIRYLTDNRIESVLDNVIEGGLTDGLMYKATEAFLATTEFYLQAGIRSDQYNEPEGGRTEEIVKAGLTPPKVIGGGIVAVLVGGGFFLLTRRRYQGKPKPVVYNYQDKNLVEFKVNNEKLVDTAVTFTIIEQSSSSSSAGRSSTHSSSSGRTHGGGGRKF